MASRNKKQSQRSTSPKNTARPNRSKTTSLSSDPEKPAKDFTVVGIGASAGGLEAFVQFLKNLPAKTGMAFVFVQHLDPHHASQLVEILSRVTTIPIVEARNDQDVEPDHIYIIPPNSDLEIKSGQLKVTRRKDSIGVQMPIDFFFRSLAADQKSKAIAIILSGTGTDGTLGCQEIKEQGGIVIVQDEKTAKYEGMPRSAISSGYVDLVMSVDQMPGELKRIASHPYIQASRKVGDSEVESSIQQIFNLLRAHAGVDFNAYKRSTLERRILRRAALNKISDLRQYLKLLQENRFEMQTLFQDILIKVTSFFREPAVFEALKKRIFPKLLRGRPPEDPIRIWIPGCSTGEEAYSIAIVLQEFMDRQTTNYPVQIFATDVSDWAIEKARAAFYVENISADISPQRLRRFFTRIGDGYEVNKSLRDSCVFARHDVTRDPPFSRLDLVSCRNLLIYLDQPMQRRVIPIFHYSLKPGGFFVLGSSESLTAYPDSFSLVDKKCNIYQRKEGVVRPLMLFDTSDRFETSDHRAVKPSDRLISAHDLMAEADRIVLGRYSPSGVIINQNMDILQFRGHTGKFLEPPSGDASFKLLRMAREGLAVPLRLAVQQAIKEDVTATKSNITYRHNGEMGIVNIEVVPIAGIKIKERHYLVLFKEIKDSSSKSKKEKMVLQSKYEKREVVDLRRELESTKEYLQAIIEEHEATNEELRSANEEIQSSNEELQSINEELETNKEEVQSANEELTTLNEELQNRNVELDHLNNDLQNLISSIHIPILMLGNDFRVRFYTPTAQNVFNLKSIDIGRSIQDIRSNFDFSELESMIRHSMETLEVQEREIKDHADRWWSVRVRPYRTKDNKIEGTVLIMVDITDLKSINRDLQMSRDFAEAIVKTVKHPLVILDSQYKMLHANDAFFNAFGSGEPGKNNENFFEFNRKRWNIPELRRKLEALIEKGKPFSEMQISKSFPEAGTRTLVIDALPIHKLAGDDERFLLAIEDATERIRSTEIAYQQTMLKEIHHRIKNNLQIISSLLHLQSNYISDTQMLEMFRDSQNRIKSMALVHEKLYQSKDLTHIDFAEYVKDLTRNLQRSYVSNHAEIAIDVPIKQAMMTIDTAVPCALIVSELVSNALKYAFPDGRKGSITVDLKQLTDGHGDFTLIVKDDGIGLPEDLNIEKTETLGLLLVRKLVEQLDGRWNVSRGKGTTFQLHLKESPSRPVHPA